MTINAGNQTDVALDRMTEESGGHDLAVTGQDPAQPQTPFPTSLIITREQEEKLVGFAIEYIDRLELQMGRVIVAGNQTYLPDETTHFGKRDLYTLRYYNHVEDRKLGKEDSIFKHSNITASLSQRTTMQMVARANNFFFGTDPWYSCNFVGTEDRPLAERVDRHSKWKFDQTRLKDELMMATEFAFVRGESVLKTTHQTKERYYQKKGKTLHDEAGVQVLDTDNNPIFQGAAFVDEFQAQVPPAVDPAAAQQDAMQATQPVPAVLVPTGRKVLKRDPKTVIPAVQIWKDGLWPVKKRIFRGPECKLVFYKDFLCSLAEPNVHDAELIAHLYDMPVMSLIENFKREDLAQLKAGESLEAMRKAVEAIRIMAGQGPDPKSAAAQPRSDFGGSDNTGSPENHLAQIAEIYLRYDANEDGIAEEIMLVLDRANRFPLFYDYLDNTTPKGRRPFEIIRGKPVDNVWWGMGSMEYFQPEQEFIDLLVNRRNFRSGGTGRITFWNPSATMEGSANPNLKLNNGMTYRLQPDKKASDALEYVELPDDTTDLVEMLNFWAQLMQMKSGVVNAGDQEASGLPSAKLATGIRNVEKSGQEMFAQWLNGLEPGHGAALRANIVSLYTYMDEEEVYRFFADDGKQASDILQPEEVQDMEFDVTILLTRIRTEQVLEMSQAARALVIEFYTLMPPIQVITATFYRDSLKALGYNNADSIIQPQLVAMMPPGQPGMGGAPGGGMPPGGAPAGPPAPATPGKGIDAPSPPSPRPEASAALI